jgi:hypothetical protein
VLAAFTVPMKVEVRQPEFEPLSTLAALDVERLSRGNHKIEIGFIKGGCCRNLVRAVIKSGMVTGCEIEPCEESERMSVPPQLMKLLQQARKKVQRGRTWQPIPVAQLISSSARMLDLIIIIGGGCIYICIWDFCFMCCWYPRPHCFKPVISTGPL